MNKVLFFSSKSCAPCRMMKPVMDEVAEEHGIEVQYIDVSDLESSEIGKLYHIRAKLYHIRAVPTLIALDEQGAIFDISTGAITKQKLLKWLELGAKQ